MADNTVLRHGVHLLVYFAYWVILFTPKLAILKRYFLLPLRAWSRRIVSMCSPDIAPVPRNSATAQAIILKFVRLLEK
jgi:hypothetical protein